MASSSAIATQIEKGHELHVTKPFSSKCAILVFAVVLKLESRIIEFHLEVIDYRNVGIMTTSLCKPLLNDHLLPCK